MEVNQSLSKIPRPTLGNGCLTETRDTINIPAAGPTKSGVDTFLKTQPPRAESLAIFLVGDLAGYGGCSRSHRSGQMTEALTIDNRRISCVTL